MATTAVDSIPKYRSNSALCNFTFWISPLFAPAASVTS